MGWNGDSRSYDFRVKATQKEFIQILSELVGGQFPDAMPAFEDMKLEVVPLSKEIEYYQYDFSYGYHLSDVLDTKLLQTVFPGLAVLQELQPFHSIKIEMIIERSNANEYTHHTQVDFIYICSPSKPKPKEPTMSKVV